MYIICFHHVFFCQPSLEWASRIVAVLGTSRVASGSIKLCHPRTQSRNKLCLVTISQRSQRALNTNWTKGTVESPGHRFLDSWVCLLQLAKRLQPPWSPTQVETHRLRWQELTQIQICKCWIHGYIWSELCESCFSYVSLCFSRGSRGYMGIWHTDAYGISRLSAARVRKNEEKSFCKMVMSWPLLLPRFRDDVVVRELVGNVCISSALLLLTLKNYEQRRWMVTTQNVGSWSVYMSKSSTLVLTIIGSLWFI